MLKATSGTLGVDSFTGSGLDDLSASGTYTGSHNETLRVEIDATGTPDTFRWSRDGGSTWEASGVSITGSAQLLAAGVSVTFAATTGHTTSDYWDFEVGTFATIGCGGDISGVGYSRSSHDVPCQEGSVISKLPGVAVVSPISASVSIDYSSAIHDTLRTDAAAGTAREYRIDFPTDLSSVAGPVFSFEAPIESLTSDLPNDGVITASLAPPPTGAKTEA